MEFLLFLVLGAAIVAALVWTSRARSRQPSATHPAAEEVALPSDEQPAQTLQQVAEHLKPAYDASSHPHDLETHPAFQAGVGRLENPAVPLDEVVSYCVGANPQVAAMAAAALARRSDSAPAIPRLLAHFRFAYVWTDYFMLRVLARHATSPVVCRVLLEAPEWWAQNPVLPQIIGEFAEARVAGGEAIDLAAELAERPLDNLAEFEAFLAKLTAPIANTVRAQLESWRRTRVDSSFLGSVGRLWRTDIDESRVSVEHARVAAAAQLALDAILQPPHRSFAIVGEPGVGKTTLVRLLARQLSARGWTVFEASAAEILAGMTYLGELEGRIRKLIDALSVGRRIVWYLPNLHELFYAGRHRWSPVGALDLVLPAVEAGRICLVGEVQPGALAKVVQQRPRLQTALKWLVLEPLVPPEALALAGELLERDFKPLGLTVEASVVKEALELARQYLSARALPGSLVDLLRHTCSRLATGGAVVTRDDLFTTLTELTGLPRSLLDDREGLDPAELRAYFDARVMGQPEAVQCIVDRVAMLKAGLTDPNRPIGVFLFAGPTGTGKTEIARTLAEFLFGAADRMTRLDMSEFQEPASLSRILGEPAEGAEVDALVHRIRKRPFSVVLLDEFEKAHPRVWDLFLQVFDDGRLTDALGNVADFRHAIIILTSNVGATDQRGSGLGFVGGDGAFSESQVARAIAATFRPELVNRLDRVVVFRPLSRAIMREILRKELRNVLQRRGFRTRDWAVEWEESAIEFLLDRGFTRDMGARPLRRAIETYVLAPIAMTIVEHRHPEGDQFLFVRSNREAIQVEFVDPDAPPTPPPPGEAVGPALPETLALGPLILSPRGSEAERQFLGARVDELDTRLASEEWIAGKQTRLREINRPGFWDEPGRHAILDKVERMDRIEAGATTARSLMMRIENRMRRRDGIPRQIVSSLAEQLYLLSAALADLDADFASDVYLAVEPVVAEAHGGAKEEWSRTLIDMYHRWAAKRRMRLSVLADGAAPPFVIAVAGFGAHHILAKEAGLHLLEVPDEDGSFSRCTARVRVVPQPVTPKPPQQSDLEHALSCLAAGGGSNTVLRRYREQPSPLVRDALAGWRTGRLAQVLGGDFDLIGG